MKLHSSSLAMPFVCANSCAAVNGRSDCETFVFTFASPSIGKYIPVMPVYDQSGEISTPFAFDAPFFRKVSDFTVSFLYALPMSFSVSETPFESLKRPFSSSESVARSALAAFASSTQALYSSSTLSDGSSSFINSCTVGR